jgi:hypothetical protein
MVLLSEDLLLLNFSSKIRHTFITIEQKIDQQPAKIDSCKFGPLSISLLMVFIFLETAYEFQIARQSLAVSHLFK